MGGAGRKRRRAALPSRWLLFVLLVLTAVPGFIRGTNWAHAHPDDRSFADDGQYPCTTAPGEDAKMYTEMRLDVSRGRLQVQRFTQVDVPTDWWEVKALRDPDTSSNHRMAAHNCLFGTPYKPSDVEFSSTTARTRAREVENDYFVRSRDPICGLLTAQLSAHRVVIRHGPTCYVYNDEFLLTRPGTQLTARVSVRGATPLMHPTPSREASGWFEWSWTGRSATALEAAVPLDWATYATTVATNGDRVTALGREGHGLLLLPTSLSSWATVFLVAIALIIGFRTLGTSRLISFVLAFAALALLVAIGTEWRRPDGGQFAFSFTAAVGAAIAAIACATARRIATVLGIALITLLLLGIRWSHGYREDQWQGIAIAVAVVAGLLVVVALEGLTERQARALPQRNEWLWPVLRTSLAVAVAVSVGYALGFATGVSVVNRHGYSLLGASTRDAPYFLLPFVITALAVILLRKSIDQWRPDAPTRSSVAVLGVAWAALAAPRDVDLWGVGLPAGVVLLTIALVVLVRRGPLKAPKEADIDEPKAVSPSLVHMILERGRGETWRSNVLKTVETGAVLAAVPVGYFVWGALDSLPSRTNYGISGLFLAASVITESARWLATAAVFGVVYARLPGRIGPMKAASLSGMWFVVAAIVEVLSRWAGHDSGRIWTFPALQTLLFLLALALVVDYLDVRSAGGSLADLQAIYQIDGARDLVAIGIPAVLAVVAIAQQVVSGTGFDFIKGVLENVPKLTG